MTMTNDGRQFLLQLGIFDDGDVLPTLILGLFVATGNPEIDGVAFLEALDDMKRAGRKEYGRAVPASALFWFCSEKPVDIDIDLSGGL